MTRARLVTVLLFLWLCLVTVSLTLYLLIPADESGFGRGLNRLIAFVGWQIVAGAAAVLAWIIGASLPAGRLRSFSGMPIVLGPLLTLGMLGVVALQRFGPPA